MIQVRLQTSSLTYKGQRCMPYREDEIDLLAVYCAAVDRCYLLPSALVAGRRAIHLRLRPARNGQRACLNDAAEYEFAGAVAQLGRAPHWQCGGQGFESPQLHPNSVDVASHEFRNRFGHYLERAAGGDEIRISRHGRPFARLVPAEPSLAAGWIT